MTTDPRTLSLLVHAPSKTGKSTLGATCPRPIVVFDAEGGTKFLGGSPTLAQRLGRYMVIVPWDPTGPPPASDGSWDAAVVTVKTWADFQLAAQWLASGQHPFVSLVIDSVTEIQRRLKKNLVGTEQMKMQDWGQLLSIMDDIIRGLRDLANDPHNSIRVAMFIAETRQIDGKWRPYMQGQIATALPYFMDVVGYLYVDMAPDAQGQPTVPVRRLLINQTPLFEAGERVQGLVGPVIDNPDVERMLDAIYPHYAPPASQPQTQEIPA